MGVIASSSMVTSPGTGRGGSWRVVVEALAALAAVEPRLDHPLQQRRRREALLAELVEHDVRDVVGRVEPHEVQQRERPHRMAAARAACLRRCRPPSRRPPPARGSRPAGTAPAGGSRRSPVLSDARTGVLPRLCANAAASSNDSGEVSGERTTSTSFISGTGLKKCRPTKRSARFVAAAISVIESDEVLEAKIAWGGADRVERLEHLALGGQVLDDDLDHAGRSPARSSSSVVPGEAAHDLRLALGGDLALLDALGQERVDLAQALLRSSSLTSRTITW